jgi:hypothetical protein
MPHYYLKELARNPFVVNGAPVPFEVFPSNRGIIALEDSSPLVAALDDAAAKRKGGIVAIDEAAYEELKKNRGGSKISAAFSKKEPLRVFKTNAPSSPKPKASVVAEPVAPPPQPVARATRRDFRPATARVAPTAAQTNPPLV